MRQMITTVVVMCLAASTARADRLLMCGSELLAAASQLPPGLPSSQCSEVRSLGEGIRGAVGGSPRLDPASVMKAPDANSLRLRQAALEGVSLGRITLWVLEGAPGSEVALLRVDLEGALVTSVASGASKAEPVETAVLVASQTTWSVWAPAGAPGTPPTGSFCWDAALGSRC